MSPLTPNPPSTLKAPEVEDIELVLDNIDTAPINVDVDWTLRPEPIFTELVTLNPVPIFTSPLIPSPPKIVKAPEVDEVELVFESIETEPINVDVN